MRAHGLYAAADRRVQLLKMQLDLTRICPGDQPLDAVRQEVLPDQSGQTAEDGRGQAVFVLESPVTRELPDLLERIRVERRLAQCCRNAPTRDGRRSR